MIIIKKRFVKLRKEKSDSLALIEHIMLKSYIDVEKLLIAVRKYQNIKNINKKLKDLLIYNFLNFPHNFLLFPHKFLHYLHFLDFTYKIYIFYTFHKIHFLHFPQNCIFYTFHKISISTVTTFPKLYKSHDFPSINTILGKVATIRSLQFENISY